MRSIWKKYRLLALLALLPLLLSVSVFARDPINEQAVCSLVLQYECPNVEFRLYRIADMSDFGTYTAVGAFADPKYALSLSHDSQSGWQALASTLAAYITYDSIAPLEVKKTDMNRSIAFDVDRVGLYLVMGERHQTSGYDYVPQPFLVSLPQITAQDTWQYDVTADVKFSKNPVQATPTTVTRRVHKAWENVAAGAYPASITVELLCNGNAYDTVTLDAHSGWSHEWTGLDANAVWQVVERDVPENYTVLIEQRGATFLITNRYHAPEDTAEPSDTTEDTSDDTAVPPDDGENLPQTGLLWWPVPVLACLGMLLFSVGFVLARRGCDDEA